MAGSKLDTPTAMVITMKDRSWLIEETSEMDKAFSIVQTSKRGRITSTMENGSRICEKAKAIVIIIMRTSTWVSGSLTNAMVKASYSIESRTDIKVSGRMT